MAKLLTQTEAGWIEEPLASDRLSAAGASIVCAGHGADRLSVLIVRDDVVACVNGQPLLGGVCVLQHQDEILLTGTRLYFSLESRPEISSFEPGAGARVSKCAVCRVALKPGDRVVACPRCGRVFHQNDADPQGKKCWTYAAQCLCGHPTALTGDAWWPEREEALHARA